MRGLLAVLTAFIACTAPATPPVSATLAQAIPSTSAPTTPAATATADAAPRLITHDNASLGYRLALPEIYRRVSADLFIGQPELIGRDTYTNLTDAEERAECERDLGDIPSPAGAAILHVEAYRNPAGLSATQWANTPRVPGGYVLSHQRRVEPLTTGGREAVRLVADKATAEVMAFAIRADDLVYLLTPSMWPSRHALVDIAASFGTVARQPFPTATPTTAPAARQQAAGELAKVLAGAFAARDAGAVARLMPKCHVGVSPLVAGFGFPNSGGGGLSRSVPLFTQELRGRFAAGDLTVTVDPTLQIDGDVNAGGRYFVRSDWREPDRTVRIDLFLDVRDARWQWVSALHRYSRADLGLQICIPYRSPWVSATRC